MILKKELEILEKHFDTFKFEAQQNGAYWTIRNIHKFRENLQFFKEREIGLHIIERLEKYLYGTWTDELSFSSSDKDAFVANFENLKSIVRNLIIYTKKFTNKEKEDFILIKIPDNIKDFEDLKTISGDLQTILSQTILNEDINGKIDIKGAENGSIWFEIALGTALAVGVIGKIFYSAFLLYREKLKNDKIKEEIRNMKIENTASEIVVEAFDKSIKEMTKLEAANIFDEDYKLGTVNRNEQIKRIELALNILIPLIPRGLQIEPSSTSHEEIKKLFPTLEDLPNLISRVKQLSENTPK